MNIPVPPPSNGRTNAASAAELVRESSTTAFQADVIDASKSVPVLVDFWAPWCGPCRQLGPAIERVVQSYAGKVKLVKINVDENQALAGQMGIQSIPAVFAFAGGRPVDGFMGALPEGEIRRFVERILKAAPPAEDSAESQIADALQAARQAADAHDYQSAEQIYGMILQYQPDHTGALTGLAQVLITTGDLDRAGATLDMVPEDGRKSADYLSARAALQLRQDAATLGSVGELESRLAANPDDHQARFDLALALNADGFKIEAAEALVQLMRRSREWNEDGARKKLLELFEAWGPKDPATLKGRRLLSAVLFS